MSRSIPVNTSVPPKDLPTFCNWMWPISGLPYLEALAGKRARRGHAQPRHAHRVRVIRHRQNFAPVDAERKTRALGRQLQRYALWRIGQRSGGNCGGAEVFQLDDRLSVLDPRSVIAAVATCPRGDQMAGPF